VSNYQLACIEESQRWTRIAANARKERDRKYAEGVAARWAEKAKS
jgi:hypothetical protein